MVSVCGSISVSIWRRTINYTEDYWIFHFIKLTLMSTRVSVFSKDDFCLFSFKYFYLKLIMCSVFGFYTTTILFHLIMQLTFSSMTFMCVWDRTKLLNLHLPKNEVTDRIELHFMFYEINFGHYVCRNGSYTIINRLTL